MIFKIVLTDEECIVQGQYEVEVSKRCPSEEEEEEKMYIHPKDLQRTQVFNFHAKDLGDQILNDIKALYQQKKGGEKSENGN